MYRPTIFIAVVAATLHVVALNSFAQHIGEALAQPPDLSVERKSENASASLETSPSLFETDINNRRLKDAEKESFITLVPATLFGLLSRPYNGISSYLQQASSASPLYPDSQELDPILSRLWTTLDSVSPNENEHLTESSGDSSTLRNDLSTTEGVVKVMPFFPILPPLDADADTWQAAVVNLEDAITKSKAKFFQNLSATQLNLLKTFIPANAILSKIGLQGPISDPFITLLRTLSPTDLAPLRRFFPASFLNLLAAKAATAGAATAAKLGSKASSTLQLMGLEGVDQEAVHTTAEEMTVLTELTTDSLVKALDIPESTADRALPLLQKVAYGEELGGVAMARIVEDPILRSQVGPKLIHIQLPPFTTHGIIQYALLQQYLRSFYIGEKPLQEHTEEPRTDSLTAEADIEWFGSPSDTVENTLATAQPEAVTADSSSARLLSSKEKFKKSRNALRVVKP